jgi:hypothetical protein
VIVTYIWQKLNSVEREVTLIVIDFWQLFSQIIGETSLIVTNYWRNPTFSRVFTIIHSSLSFVRIVIAFAKIIVAA